MNISDLKGLSSFKQNTSNVGHRFLAEDAIANMSYYGNRILEAFDYISVNGDNSLEGQLIFDSIKGNLNDYVQAFIDIVSVLFVNDRSTKMQKISSLRQTIRYFEASYIDYSDECRHWLEFLQRRNELVHEYYNYEFLNEELKRALTNYSSGIMELVEYLRSILQNAELLEAIVKKEKNDI